MVGQVYIVLCKTKTYIFYNYITDITVFGGCKEQAVINLDLLLCKPLNKKNGITSLALPPWSAFPRRGV